MRICPNPFENIEIDSEGDVYTCCINWINNYSIGNIYDNSLDEIWNGQKVQKLRENILKGDYSLCSQEFCQYCTSGNIPNPSFLMKDEFKVKMKKYPSVVKLSYDKECNIACRICRDDIIKNTQEEYKKLDKIFKKYILPSLKNAKTVIINAHGDPFGSRHCRKVIKVISEKYPEIKFDFHTNGTLCDEKQFERLKIKEKINTMRISVSATTSETYGKIVKNGDKLFKKLKSNLEFLSQLQRERQFEFYMHFVVSSKNYKEMGDFAEMAVSYNAIPCYWEYTPNCVSFAKNLDESWIITDAKNPEYKQFKKAVKDKRLNNFELYMSPLLIKIRQEN